MTLTGWDAILTSALTVPGVADPLPPLTGDDPTFQWGRWNAPTWSAQQACDRLGIALLPFPQGLEQMIGGFATRDGIGLNPRTRRKVRTAAHEIAHVVLGHVAQPVDRDGRRMPVEEFEADCVALLICHTLDLGEIERADCRFYIQQFAALPCVGMPTTWTAITMAATTILGAGLGRFVVTPEPKPLQVQPVESFARRIQWHS